jgi:hypothetical protein
VRQSTPRICAPLRSGIHLDEESITFQFTSNQWQGQFEAYSFALSLLTDSSSAAMSSAEDVISTSRDGWKKLGVTVRLLSLLTSPVSHASEFNKEAIDIVRRLSR